MAKLVTLAALVVGGVILADIVTHGSQTAAAAQGVGQNIEQPALNALLGQAS
jgi:hypothetical protein